MSKFYLGPRSLLKLVGVHPDLVAVVKCAILMQDAVDFTVVCGLRTLARQHELVRAGASKTMHSRHLTGHAVDLAPLVNGKLTWNTRLFYPLGSLMKSAAHLVDVPIRWGGDWNGNGKFDETWIDLPHFELKKAFYADDSKLSLSPKATAFLKDPQKFLRRK